MLKIKKLAQFKKSIKNIALTETEKNAAKENIVAYMKVHPVRISDEARQKTQTPLHNIFVFLTQKHMYATLAIILTLLAGSGTAFAAENTLPGDSLYGVKVHVNEQVRSALALSSESQADWDAKVAERRLDEVAKLAASGELKADAEAQIQARFEAQTEKIRNHIEDLKEEGNVEAAANLSTRLQTALELHQEILTKIQSDSGTTKEDIKPLLNNLKDEVKEINKIRLQIEDDVHTSTGTSARSAAEGRMKASLHHIDEVRDYLENKNLTASSSAMIKLDAAVKVQAEGKAALDAGDYSKAFVLFGTAQSIAQEAKLMAHVQTDLKFDNRVDKILEDLSKKDILLNSELRHRLDDTSGRLENKIEDRLDDHRGRGEDEDKDDDRDEDTGKQEVEHTGEVKLRGSNELRGVLGL